MGMQNGIALSSCPMASASSRGHWGDHLHTTAALGPSSFMWSQSRSWGGTEHPHPSAGNRDGSSPHGPAPAPASFEGF